MGVQPFNVLRYQQGQHYDSHYDVFEPESYGPQASQRVGLSREAVTGAAQKARMQLGHEPVAQQSSRTCTWMETPEGPS